MPYYPSLVLVFQGTRVGHGALTAAQLQEE